MSDYKIEEITAYKLSNGKLVEKKEDAMKFQNNINFEISLTDAIEEMFKNYEDGLEECSLANLYAVKDMIMDHRTKLKDLLNKYC